MNVELSSEDALRLAVLMAGEVHAVRIDESAPALLALTPRGEARLVLNPTCRAETYLTHVREWLGGQALGFPGGYPVHLRRWSRIGQAGAKNLEALLRLGEPEAVAAVAQSPGLTDDLARRAWWAHPHDELARVMLSHEAVRRGPMGRLLTVHLLEHLPFEQEPLAAMHIVRSLLAAGRLEGGELRGLWQKARRRPGYLIGFLESMPAGWAGEFAPRPLPAATDAGDDAWHSMLAWCCSQDGQAWLWAAEMALDKAPAVEAVHLLLDLIRARFQPLSGRAAGALPAAAAADAGAMAALAELGRDDEQAALLRTTAVGALLRRKIDPLLAPVLRHLRTLQGKSA